MAFFLNVFYFLIYKEKNYEEAIQTLSFFCVLYINAQNDTTKLTTTDILNTESNEEDTFTELSLEDLLNVKVSVASCLELTPRESPGIITIITEEEIKNWR